ncbi:hypothetical protein JCM10213_009027 [Rhodosporidiobolus nylandii]
MPPRRRRAGVDPPSSPFRGSSRRTRSVDETETSFSADGPPSRDAAPSTTPRDAATTSFPPGSVASASSAQPDLSPADASPPASPTLSVLDDTLADDSDVDEENDRWDYRELDALGLPRFPPPAGAFLGDMDDWAREEEPRATGAQRQTEGSDEEMDEDPPAEEENAHASAEEAAPSTPDWRRPSGHQ